MQPSSLLSRVRVVLVRPRNPLNIGAAARAMSNFGFEQLRTVAPFDIAFREARSAVGALEILKKAAEYASVAEAIADCSLVVATTAATHRKPQQPVVDLPHAANLIAKQGGPVALLFGSEKRGLTNQDFGYCHWLLRIPTAEAQPSMNLGQAVAVCLYEMTRKELTIIEATQEKATARNLDLLTTILSDALLRSGYMNSDALPSTEEKVRGLVRRLNLSADDAQLLLGMVRKVARKAQP